MPPRTESHRNQFANQKCRGIRELSEPLPQQTENSRVFQMFSLIHSISQLKAKDWSKLVQTSVCWLPYSAASAMIKEKHDTNWDFVSAAYLDKQLKYVRNETRKNNLRVPIPGKWVWRCPWWWWWFESPPQLLRFQFDPLWILISESPILNFWFSGALKIQTLKQILNWYLLSSRKVKFWDCICINVIMTLSNYF